MTETANDQRTALLLCCAARDCSRSDVARGASVAETTLAKVGKAYNYLSSEALSRVCAFLGVEEADWEVLCEPQSKDFADCAGEILRRLHAKGSLRKPRAPIARRMLKYPEPPAPTGEVGTA